MPNDRRIVFLASPPARAHTPCQRAQLVGGGFDRINAWKAWNFSRLFLRLRNQRLKRPVDRLQRRCVKGHLNTKVRPEAFTYREKALIRKVGREKLALIANQGLVQSSNSCAVRAERIRSRKARRLLRLAVPLAAAGIATLKSISSENRLIRPHPFESEVPPEKTSVTSA